MESGDQGKNRILQLFSFRVAVVVSGVVFGLLAVVALEVVFGLLVVVALEG